MQQVALIERRVLALCGCGLKSVRFCFCDVVNLMVIVVEECVSLKACFSSTMFDVLHNTGTKMKTHNREDGRPCTKHRRKKYTRTMRRSEGGPHCRPGFPEIEGKENGFQKHIKHVHHFYVYTRKKQNAHPHSL